MSAVTRTDQNRTTPERGFQPAENGPVLWAALCEDCGAACLVVSGGGIIQSASRMAVELLAGGPGDYAGRPITELLGDSVASERAAMIEEVAASGRASSIDGMVRGRMVRMTARPLAARAPGGMVLIVARPISEDESRRPGSPTRRAHTDDMGQLETLTTRELDILRHIGRGLSTPAIAQKLGRSVKTVEWHRVSLGEKLGVSNRVELARIAISCGLVGSGDVPAAPVGAG